MVEVADYLGRDPQSVHRWEVGIVVISTDVLYDFARLYGLSTATLTRLAERLHARQPSKKKTAA